jgi:TonB family protein
MRSFVRYAALLVIVFLFTAHSPAQNTGQNVGKKGADPRPEGADQKPERKIWIKLKSGETLTGNLQKIDLESVDFTVKNILQTISLDEVESVSFVSPTSAARPTPTPRIIEEQPIFPMTATLKPTILYREKARYTEEAKNQGVQGTVVLQVVFQANGAIGGVKVIRGLPYGLTESAIGAARKIKFEPAVKDGKPVSVRGSLEFTFNP